MTGRDAGCVPLAFQQSAAGVGDRRGAPDEARGGGGVEANMQPKQPRAGQAVLALLEGTSRNRTLPPGMLGSADIAMMGGVPLDPALMMNSIVPPAPCLGMEASQMMASLAGDGLGMPSSLGGDVFAGPGVGAGLSSPLGLAPVGVCQASDANPMMAAMMGGGAVPGAPPVASAMPPLANPIVPGMLGNMGGGGLMGGATLAADGAAASVLPGMTSPLPHGMLGGMGGGGGLLGGAGGLMPPAPVVSPVTVVGTVPVVGAGPVVGSVPVVGAGPVVGSVPVAGAGGAPAPMLGTGGAPAPMLGAGRGGVLGAAPIAGAPGVPMNGTGDVKLVPLAAESVLKGMQGPDAPSPMMVAMMSPVTDCMMPGTKVGPSALELLQQAATDPPAAVLLVNGMLGPGACDESTVQAAAMQLTMRQAYAFATNLARSMGYHSLEHYELHKQSLLKASTSRGSTKRGGGGDKKLTLFVGGLRKDTDDDKLREHFAKYGEVTRADVIRNVDGTSRGFGFVKFASDAAIERCIEAKFEHILDGQWVNVKVSDPNRADAGKNASRAVEIAAANAGVEPSQYLDYLKQFAKAKYGYRSSAEADDSADASAFSRYQPY